MGRNNHNAGMHFVRYRCNSYEPYDYDRYADIMAEHMMRKSLEKKENKVVEQKVDPVITTKIEKAEKVNNIDKIFEDACKQADRIYAMLFLCSIKNHSNLKEISREATALIKSKTSDNSVDDMVFLSMTSKMIGMNIGQLASVSDDDIKEIVYDNILAAMDDYSINGCNHADDADYIEAGLSLMDYSKEDDVRYYYMSLRDAVTSDKMDLLPDVYVHYDITFYRIKDDNNESEYAVAISISDRTNENYLNWYEAIAYTEKEGRLAEFFEKAYKA